MKNSPHRGEGGWLKDASQRGEEIWMNDSPQRGEEIWVKDSSQRGEETKLEYPPQKEKGILEKFLSPLKGECLLHFLSLLKGERLFHFLSLFKGEDKGEGYMNKNGGSMAIILLLGIFALAPPTNVRAYDTPDDGGGAITVEWQLSADDALLEGYEIYRSEDGIDYEKVGFIGRGRNVLEDETEDGKKYYYKVAALSDTGIIFSEPSPVVMSSAQWINRNKINIVVAIFVFGGIILYFTYHARKGKELYIRKIAGVQAIDDAIGRATEMGKPILYCPGIGYMEDIATIASLSILGEVAKKCAQYNTKLINPHVEPIVYTVAREIVKEAYTKAGRPDAFDPDSVYFITDLQFAYAAAVDGIMVRERPATNFLIGWFRAESLILAETGASTGAIQIAGTDQVSQLPFFVTACDYTLIGEELYAASAYISKEPLLLGAIKGEDSGKLVIAGVLAAASILGLLTKLPLLNLFR